MAFNDGFYWFKNVLKKQLKLASRIYLSIAIVLAPIFLMSSANAASFGGWTITNTVAQGASTILTGSKEVILNGAKKIATGTATITPTASQVSKVLARGAAGYALSVAVEQLLGAVDWVLDPANNRIVYNETATRELLNLVSCEYKAKQQNKTGKITSQTQVISGTTYVKCFADGVYWDAFVQGSLDNVIEVETEEKTLPLETVAAQVISNAESGDTNAQVATSAAAADIINEAENDNVKARPIVQQLENTQSIPTDQTAEGDAVPKDDTANPSSSPATSAPPIDISLDFPIFCDWAPSICQAAKEVIALPITLTEWWETGKTKAESWAQSISESWTAAKEWANSEPQEQDSNELEFEDLNIDAEQVNLSGSNICPQDSVSFSVMGNSVTLDMPYQPVCDALNFFKPAVLLVGAVASVYIVSGVRTKEEDQS